MLVEVPMLPRWRFKGCECFVLCSDRFIVGGGYYDEMMGLGGREELHGSSL